MLVSFHSFARLLLRRTAAEYNGVKSDGRSRKSIRYRVKCRFCYLFTRSFVRLFLEERKRSGRVTKAVEGTPVSFQLSLHSLGCQFLGERKQWWCCKGCGRDASFVSVISALARLSVFREATEWNSNKDCESEASLVSVSYLCILSVVCF